MNKLEIRFSSKMKKQMKLVQSRGKDMTKLLSIVKMLSERTPLNEKYKDHALKGKYEGSRECHIEPDWLLVYEIHEHELILKCTGTGTHTDIFG